MFDSIRAGMNMPVVRDFGFNLFSCGGTFRVQRELVSFGTQIAHEVTTSTVLLPRARSVVSLLGSVGEMAKLTLLAVTFCHLFVQICKMTNGKLNGGGVVQNLTLMGLATPMTFFYLKDTGERIRRLVQKRNKFKNKIAPSEHPGRTYAYAVASNKKELKLEIAIFTLKFVALSSIFVAGGLGIAKIFVPVQVGRVSLIGGSVYLLGVTALRCYSDRLRRTWERNDQILRTNLELPRGRSSSLD